MKKDGWKYKRLGDVGVIITGNTPSTNNCDNYSSNDYCFFKPGDFQEDGITILQDSSFYISSYAYNNTRKLHKGEVLTTCIGTIGKVGIVQQDSTCNQQINAIAPDESLITSPFLAYSILAKKEKLIFLANAPVVPILNKSQFSNILIPLPPLPIQHQIVSHLDKLNEIIDKQRELLKVLDKLEQSIFYEMFGDPVKNEKGWEIKTLEEVCTKITDGEHLRPEVTDEGIPFLSAKDITKGYVDFSDTLFVSSETAKKSRLRCNPEYNDILIISRGATIGRSCKNDSHKVFCLLGSVILLKPDINIESDFILHFLKDKDVVQYLYSLCGAAAQQAIYLKSLKVLSIPLPPLSLQQSFASRITYIEQQKQAIQSSIDKFQEMLDGAMDEYFGDD